MSFLRVIGRIILYLLAGIGMLSAVVLIGLVTFILSARDEPTSPDRIVLVLDFGQNRKKNWHSEACLHPFKGSTTHIFSNNKSQK